MPIYNFKSRFADAVRSGVKKQTIRARGKRKPPKVGELAHCYTGLRTKHVCPLGVFPIVRVEFISISSRSRSVCVPREPVWRLMDEAEIEQLARDDGFASADEFFAFFAQEHGGTMAGYLVQWAKEVV